MRSPGWPGLTSVPPVPVQVLTKFNLADTYKGQEEATGEDYNVEEVEDGPRPFTCLLDTGLKRTSTGSKVFAALKARSFAPVLSPLPPSPVWPQTHAACSLDVAPLACEASRTPPRSPPRLPCSPSSAGLRPGPRPAQGGLDGGLDIPHSEKRFVGYSSEDKKLDAETLRNYIYGGNVRDYMEWLEEENGDKYHTHFARALAEGIDTENVEDMYKEARLLFFPPFSRILDEADCRKEGRYGRGEDGKRGEM